VWGWENPGEKRVGSEKGKGYYDAGQENSREDPGRIEHFPWEAVPEGTKLRNTGGGTTSRVRTVHSMLGASGEGKNWATLSGRGDGERAGRRTRKKQLLKRENAKENRFSGGNVPRDVLEKRMIVIRKADEGPTGNPSLGEGWM